MNRTTKHRGAFVSIWALVVMAVVTALAATAFSQLTAARRQVEAHRNRVQADWLAETGIELAAAGILSDSAYAGEEAKPIPQGEATITVTRDKDSYKIQSTARYPVGDRAVVTSKAVRSYRRVETGGAVKLEVLP